MYYDKDSLVLTYCKKKDPELREKILVCYRPLVRYISQKLSYNKQDFEDLVQVASIALLRSLDRFDPKKEVDFSTFATPNIIGEIKHYFRDKNRLVKVPRKLQELYSKVKTFIRAEQMEDRSPTIPEIAAHFEVSEEKILESLEVGQASFVLSLDSPSHSSDDSSSNSTLLDHLGVDDKEDSLLNKETLKQAISNLDEREKKVIYFRFYCGLSQMEIAKRLDLSQMHISRLLRKALDDLHGHLTEIENS